MQPWEGPLALWPGKVGAPPVGGVTWPAARSWGGVSVTGPVPAALDVRGPRTQPPPRPEPAPCSLSEGNPVINHPQRGLPARAQSHWLLVTSSSPGLAAQLA